MTHPADAALRTARLVGAFCAAAAGLYTLVGAEPSPVVLLFFNVGPLVAVVAWLQHDAHRTGVGALHDWGWFLCLAWPAIVPWYALRTRGWRGFVFGVGTFLLIMSGAIGGLAGMLLHATMWPDA